MAEIDLSRRELLGAVGLGAGYWLLSGRGEESVAGGTALSDASPRDARIRPLAGGTWISTEETDAYGSLGIGVEQDGNPAVVTNRHVVDLGSSEDPADVQGRAVYQPSPGQADLIGPVEDASTIGGSGSSDWVVISVSDSSDWGTETLGIGGMDDEQDPALSVGDRVVIDGAATGLIGAEISDTGVSANFRGELYSDLVEYVVDENRETAGNSGGLVAQIDATGTTRPVGLHTFSSADLNYAINWGDLPASVSISSTEISPNPPDSGTWIEGAIYERDSNGIHIRTANIGGTSGSANVRLLDPSDGSEISSTSISLAALARQDVTLSASGYDTIRLSVGQTEIRTTIPESAPT